MKQTVTGPVVSVACTEGAVGRGGAGRLPQSHQVHLHLQQGAARHGAVQRYPEVLDE